MNLLEQELVSSDVWIPDSVSVWTKFLHEMSAPASDLVSRNSCSQWWARLFFILIGSHSQNKPSLRIFPLDRPFSKMFYIHISLLFYPQEKADKWVREVILLGMIFKEWNFMQLVGDWGTSAYGKNFVGAAEHNLPEWNLLNVNVVG